MDLLRAGTGTFPVLRTGCSQVHHTEADDGNVEDSWLDSCCLHRRHLPPSEALLSSLHDVDEDRV